VTSVLLFLAASDNEVIDVLRKCSEYMTKCASSYGATVTREVKLGSVSLGDWTLNDFSHNFSLTSKIIGNISVAYHRRDPSNQYNNFTLNVIYSRHPVDKEGNNLSPFLNDFKIVISNTPNDLEKQLQIDVWVALNEFVAERMPSAVETGSPIVDNAIASLNNLKSIHEMLVQQLAKQSSEVSQRATEQASKLSKEFDERNKKLTEELDRERRLLAESKHALDERERTLDNRSHMHVRRESRSNMASELKTRLETESIPDTVRRLRWGIIVGCLTGLGFFGLLTAWSLVEISTQFSTQLPEAASVEIVPAPEKGTYYLQRIYYLVIKGALSGIGFAATLFYLIGWLKRTHDSDLKSERELERYRFDLDRASWVIETVLEASEKESRAVPTQWLEAATRTMFSRQSSKNEEADPLDALGALLNMTARAEIGVNGTRLELGRGDLRKVTRAHDHLKGDE
jgi:hypothetical protein